MRKKSSLIPIYIPFLNKKAKRYVSNCIKANWISSQGMYIRMFEKALANLFKKPAIFLTSNELIKSWIGPRINNLAKSINGKIINISNDLNYKLNKKDLLKIDEVKYKSYLVKY